MAGKKRYSVMRDPVHGDVYLTHEELRVLDTPEMQRLRGVKQLGTAYLVYPGAVHTRFDHSIGTVHLTQKLIDSINLSFELDPARSIAISEEESRVVRLAALLHDVTHIPFGHNIEDQDGLFERHDSAYRYTRMFAGSALGRVLDELGVREDVFSILTKPGTEGRREIPPYWSQIISGTIAADILDYLARDAYFTGLRLEVDPRVTSYFKIERASGNLYIDLAKHDLLREDILSEIVRMLEGATVSGASHVRQSGVDTDRFEGQTSGTGSLSVTGRADRVEARASGAGSMDLTQLTARTAELRVSGAGSVSRE